MKHERITCKLLSALLAFAMLFAVAAEGVGYVYAEELQGEDDPAAVQVQGSDETEDPAEEDRNARGYCRCRGVPRKR